MPFLNSLMLEPSDRAICGSRLAPNKTKTMTRMTSSSCEPRPNIGALLGENSSNYYSTHPSEFREGLKHDQTHTINLRTFPCFRGSYPRIQSSCKRGFGGSRGESKSDSRAGLGDPSTLIA